MLGRLGRGGMGTVYLGEDVSGRQVAVKVINPEYSRHEPFRMRFRREADAARRVRRFCTAAVLEAALDGDQLYVVTEYVPGPSLEAAVAGSGPLRGSSLDALAVGVATALTAIHGAGVVHRDLKPSNVLLSPVGPRVIDFGIARALDTLDGITGTGEIIGTPRYMSPEVLRGEPVSPACDVFSWGCLVAFAASGRPPFAGETLPAVLFHVLNSAPELSDLEPVMRDLVSRALDKDPARRPTAQQLLDSLVGRAAVPEQAASTVRSTWVQESGPAPAPAHGGGWRRGLWTGVAAAAVALAAAGAGVVWALSPGGPPQDLALLYQDDFTQSGTGWDGSTYNSDTTSYGYSPEGFYAIDVWGDNASRAEDAPIPFVPEPPATPDPSATPTPVTPGRLLLGVDVSVRQGTKGAGEYGLYCRGGDGYKATRYEFLLNTTGGVRIRRVQNGGGGDLAMGTVPVTQGKPVRLQAECGAGPGTVTLTMWVDGEQVLTHTDSTPLPNGQVGVLARVGEKSSAVLKTSFDNFSMNGSAPQSVTRGN
ncbi:hypothetical protein Misp01_59030 [Microtetraspora sp. NBRC 13810]|nr:hypothetical protein Misp01_59030 [Microtetraspora sp. NBRC 13810]